MFRTKSKSNLKAGMTLAALALTAAACPAEAQFNTIGSRNGLVPLGTTMFAPVGGGVLGANGFNSRFGFNNGFASNAGVGFNTLAGVNSQFSPFNAQLASFNARRAATPATDFQTRLAFFNAQRTALANQMSQLSSSLNIPASNFNNLPQIALQANGGFGNGGFVTVNPFMLANNSFGTNNTVVTNNSAQTQRDFRGTSNGNVQVNFPQSFSHTGGTFNAMSAAQANAQAVNTNRAYPWPIQPAPVQYPNTYYLLGQSSAAVNTRSNMSYPWPIQPAPTTQYPNTYYLLGQSSAASPSMNRVYPWPVQPSPTTRYPNTYYLLGSSSMPAAGPAYGTRYTRFGVPPVIGGAPVAFGSTRGATMMGARAR